MKKYLHDLQLFGIKIRIEAEEDYVWLNRFQEFFCEANEAEYVYTITSCENIDTAKDIIYQTEHFDISGEAGNEVCRFIRYDFPVKDRVFGVENRFHWGEKRVEVSFTKDYLETFQDRVYPFPYFGFERMLLEKEGFLLHASLINWQGKGIAFSAASGIGKSTQASLWERYRNAEIINGDRAGIRRIEKGVYYAYGSPMAGSSGVVKNKKVPLNSIVLLRQAKENRIRRAGVKEAFTALYKETLMNTWNPIFMQKMTELLFQVVSEVPIYILECRPDEEAVEILTDAILAD